MNCALFSDGVTIETSGPCSAPSGVSACEPRSGEIASDRVLASLRPVLTKASSHLWTFRRTLRARRLARCAARRRSITIPLEDGSRLTLDAADQLAAQLYLW